MSSRKMCVCLFMVLTILWGMSAGYVLAQESSATTSQNEQKSSGTATTTVIVPDVHPMPIGVPTPPSMSAQGVQVQYGSREEMRKAQEQMKKAAEEMKKLAKMRIDIRGPGGGFGIGQGDPFLPGTNWSWNWSHSEDPETKALREKEQKIEEETDKIVEQYNGTQDKEERAKLKKQLQDKTVEQFDVRQQYRELEVKRLEKELAQIRASIQKRNEKRDEIIKRRIGQLIHENEEDLEF